MGSYISTYTIKNFFSSTNNRLICSVCHCEKPALYGLESLDNLKICLDCIDSRRYL